MSKEIITDSQLKIELENHPKYTRYKEWKEKYPEVYNQFKKLCEDLVFRNRKFGISLVTERIRWEYKFNYNEEFKISNDFRSLITRDLMLEIPRMKECCRIKEVDQTDNIEESLTINNKFNF